jgi:integrase
MSREYLWRTLKNVSLKDAAMEWLGLMPLNTKKNYLSGLRMLTKLEIINLDQSIQTFSLSNHDLVFDKIANISTWSECTKQARAALYISLTRFLSRRTEGIIKKAVPQRGDIRKTFFKIREKVKTEALHIHEWKKLIYTMKKINLRDAIVAKLCIQGARRIQEVLNLSIPQINPQKMQILFRLNKTRGLAKDVIVTIPESAMQEILTYMHKRRQGYLFITSKGKQVRYSQIMKSLKRAAKLCKINKRIHTHVLRTSAITYLRSLGLQDFEIQRLTGHASTEMLNAYDKTTMENNSSQRISLI